MSGPDFKNKRDKGEEKSRLEMVEILKFDIKYSKVYMYLVVLLILFISLYADLIYAEQVGVN